MRFLLFFLSFVYASLLWAQPWLKVKPGERIHQEMSFFDHQKAFYDYWKGKNVDASGYYMENGVRKKAAGWKQFKRWEHYWESRVDHQTGAFPSGETYELANRMYKEDLSKRTETGNWVNLGPVESWGGYWGVGRINHIAFHPNDPNTLWVTTPQGGVWMTSNGGGDWMPLTDDQEVMATTAIALSPDFSSSQTIYLGTGEMDDWRLSGGVGVLKSTDGGNTWMPTGLTFNPADEISVNKILIHPNNYQTIYAATSDGIFKSINGGSSWDWIYTEPYISDLEFKPDDPSTLFAANKYWGRIYKLSNDGSNVFIVHNEWDNGARRIELATCPSNPSRVYAVAVDEHGGMYNFLRSTDSGSNYNVIYTPGPSQNAPNILNINQYGDDVGGQGWYDIALIVDPNNSNHVYCGGINTWESYNGGSSWTLNNFWTDYYCPSCEIAHADKHYFAYNGNTLYESNDGGLYKTVDGENWSVISDGIINSQLYKLGVNLYNWRQVLTGMQDNGVKKFDDGSWQELSGGDGMDCYFQPPDPNVQYYILQNGNDFYRTDNNWQTKTDIKPEGSEGAWTTPYIAMDNSPFDLYAGFQHVYKSTDKGENWSIIFNQNSESRFRCIDVAPYNRQVIWASDRYNIWKTTNGGTSWTNMNSGLPGNMITDIHISIFDENKVFLTMGEFDEHAIYKTTNGGTTWTNISAGLPPIPANCLEINHFSSLDGDELYLGTDFGVYVKAGDANWQLFSGGMPKVAVTELEITYLGRGKGDRDAFDMIRAATYGRGLWESNCYSQGQAPTCDFSADKTQIAAGESVQFTDLSSYGNFRSWQFEGGDPSFSNDANPLVSYNAPGIYEVSLYVTNGHGNCEKVEDGYIKVICGELNYKADKARSLAGSYSDLGNMGYAIYTSNQDDANSSPVSIGFDFEFNCQTFDQFILNTNGFIRLGNQAPSKAAMFYDFPTGNDNGIFNSQDSRDVNIICPFNHDLKSAGNAEYRVYTTGSAPDRVCTIQFEGLREKTTDPVLQYHEIEFQIKLYETSNQIEFIYGDWIPSGYASAYKSAAGGLKGSSAQEKDLLVVGKNSSSEWSNVYFENANYLPGGYGLNFGAPPERPKPDMGRTYRFTPVYLNDNAIRYVYALGKSSIDFSNPQTLTALVKNTGLDVTENLNIQLHVTGANPYFDSKVIAHLNPGEETLVNFDGIVTESIGVSNIKVSLGSDAFEEDNEFNWTHEATPDMISYANEEEVSSGWGYLAGFGGMFLSKHVVHGSAKIASVDVYIFPYQENIGQQVSGVLMDSDGNLLAESPLLTISAGHLGNWYSFTFDDPPTVNNSQVLAGLKQQVSNTGESFYPLGVQDESPSRLETYYTCDLNGSNLEAREADFDHRHMIGIRILQEYNIGVASADKEEVCAGESVALSITFPDSGIQWQNFDGANWQDIPGATGQVYMSGGLSSSRIFRAKVTFPDQSVLFSNQVEVIVHPVFSGSDEYEVCQGANFTFHDGTQVMNVTSDMVHSNALQSSEGCDSIIETTLIVYPVYDFVEYEDLCQGENYTFPDGTQVSNLMADRSHVSHLLTQQGCDSVIETHLSVYPTYFVEEWVEICEGDAYTFPDGFQLSDIEIDVDHISSLQSVFECDSIISTHLVVLPFYESEETVFICSGESYLFPDGTFVENISEETIHLSHLLSINGCDSLVETSVNVYPEFLTNEEIHLCAGDAFVFPDGTQLADIQEDVEHISTLQTLHFCDSVIVTNLLVEPVFEVTVEEEICQGDDFQFPDGTQVFNVQYDMEQQSSLKSIDGCDSIVNTLLEVIDLGVGITSFDGALIAYPNELEYQWLNCDQNHQPVEGELEQNFEPFESGNYAVVGFDGHCRDTSECVFVIGSLVEDQNVREVRIYPNPVHKELIIESPVLALEECIIYSLQGQDLVAKFNRIDAHKIHLSVQQEGLSEGVYLLKVVTNEGSQIFKVIFQ
jgi:PKD repeat protein